MINVPNSSRKPNVPAIYHVLVFCAVQCDFFLTAAGCLHGRATPYAAARAFVKFMATYLRIGQSAPDRLRSVEGHGNSFAFAVFLFDGSFRARLRGAALPHKKIFQTASSPTMSSQLTPRGGYF